MGSPGHVEVNSHKYLLMVERVLVLQHSATVIVFLPRDATQSNVMPRQVVCTVSVRPSVYLSVCLSVCDVQV